MSSAEKMEFKHDLRELIGSFAYDDEEAIYRAISDIGSRLDWEGEEGLSSSRVEELIAVAPSLSVENVATFLNQQGVEEAEGMGTYPKLFELLNDEDVFSEEQKRDFLVVSIDVELERLEDELGVLAAADPSSKDFSNKQGRKSLLCQLKADLTEKAFPSGVSTR